MPLRVEDLREGFHGREAEQRQTVDELIEIEDLGCVDNGRRLVHVGPFLDICTGTTLVPPSLRSPYMSTRAREGFEREKVHRVVEHDPNGIVRPYDDLSLLYLNRGVKSPKKVGRLSAFDVWVVVKGEHRP